MAIFQSRSGFDLGPAVQQASSQLGQVLEQIGQQQKQKKQSSLLGGILEEAQQKAASEGRDFDQEDIMEIFTKTQKAGIPLDKSLDLMKTMSTAQKQSPSALKKEEKLNTLQSGLKTVEEMEELFNTGNIGTQFGFTIDQSKRFGKSGEDRAKFRQLGVSLIQAVSKGVPVRNQAEFNEFKKIITDPSAQTEDIKGAIEGLKSLFSNEIDSLSSRKRKSSEVEEKVEEKETVSLKGKDGKIYKIPVELKEEFLREQR